jgi:hypothetical protein
MIVIGHQTVGVAEPVKAVGDLRKSIEKKLPVTIVSKDWFLFIAPRGDVVKSTVVLDA